MEGRRVSERGFTLIELLVVVAILGVLAAVVIPNVGRFIGAGEEEAKDIEFSNIQAAVHAMMVDNELDTLPNPVDTVATNDMSAFPDATSDWTESAGGKTIDLNGSLYAAEDIRGYLLYGHDMRGGGSREHPLVDYTLQQYSKGTYTVDASGTVTQVGYE